MTNYKTAGSVTSWHPAPSKGPLETGQRMTDPFPPPGMALTCDDARLANGLLTLGGGR